MSVRRIVLFGFLGVIGFAMAIGIAALLFPGGWVSDELMFTIFISSLYAFGALVAATVARAMKRTLGVCLTLFGVSLGIVLAAIWTESTASWETTERMFRSGSTLVFAAIALVHRMIFAPMTMRSTIGRIALRTTLISAPILAALLAFILWAESWFDFDEFIARLIGVVAIIMTGSSAASGVFWFVERRPEHDEPGTMGQSVPVVVGCPRCGGSVECASNRDARCESCRLKIRVEIEEPRCACGYLLYQLAGENCPECGRAIDEDDRWHRDGTETGAPVAAEPSGD